MHKTAYEMRISDWSSDVCSSDLPVLDRLCSVLETEPLHVVVVEILVARAHAADVERKLRPDGIPAGLEIVAHPHADVHSDIEVAQRLCRRGFRYAFEDGRRDRFRLLRNHPDRQCAVGDFACGTEAGGGDRCRVALQVRLRVHDALERLAERSEEHTYEHTSHMRNSLAVF